VRLCDALEVVSSACETSSDSIRITGLDIKGEAADNIIMKAVHLLRRKYTIPWLRIHLHKAIPTGAGLGGGSSDAAAMLKILCRMFSVPAGERELSELALELGSDVPFFIRCMPSAATGRGEQMEPLPDLLKGYHLVLINPGSAISTSEAYGSCRPAQREVRLGDFVLADINHWRDNVTNDFEDFAFSTIPVLAEVKDALYKAGALFSAMSGSGSTMYGVFAGRPKIPEWLEAMVIYSGSN
jgi:4-diphosphocytidyl-2-C-methyl-D-erythritol kinase